MATSLDALIAELLGDVGKLHDEIKELPSSLEGITSDYLAKLERASALIDDRASHLRQVTTQAADEHAEKIESVFSNANNNVAELLGRLDGKRDEITKATKKLEAACSELQELQERMLSDTASNVAELVNAYTASKKEAELLDLKSSIRGVVDEAIRLRVETVFSGSLQECSSKIEKLGSEAETFSDKIKENYSDVSGFLSRAATVALCVVCSVASVVGLRIIGFL
ncbi:hypothetical protein [Aeromonas hydrophila]|uniref:hypothetical protein n=1 Tax=Aeromonas hydrophila TaxID=644 RepID=UPI001C5B0B87|nr:hypothetical protein [Aeromonas hydrophila]MBW3847030.1 hypothetical protein [Aeromonas hydrophila]